MISNTNVTIVFNSTIKKPENFLQNSGFHQTKINYEVGKVGKKEIQPTEKLLQIFILGFLDSSRDFV